MSKNDFGSKKSHSEPGPGDGGKTGSWRVVRPVIDLKKCIPAIDYEYCKGCEICAEECPVDAITMIEETTLIKEEK